MGIPNISNKTRDMRCKIDDRGRYIYYREPVKVNLQCIVCKKYTDMRCIKTDMCPNCKLLEESK